jgi:hypothetical protein
MRSFLFCSTSYYNPLNDTADHNTNLHVNTT